MQKNSTTPIQAVKTMAARLQEQNIALPGVAVPPPTPKGKLPPKTIKGVPRAVIEAQSQNSATTSDQGEAENKKTV